MECKDRKQREREKNQYTLTDRQIDRHRIEWKRETQRYAKRKREKWWKKIRKQKCSNKGA